MSTNLESKVTLEKTDNVNVERKRSWFSRRKILITLFVILAVLSYFCLVPSRLVLSPETTLITLLKPDGTPDYVGAFLLEHNGQLTNPDSNGLRMVIEKFGPYILEQSALMRDCVWEDLPKDESWHGKFYREKWIPLCNAMSIDPAKKPVEYKPISAKIVETKKEEYKKSGFHSSLTTKSWRAEDYPDIAEFVRENEGAMAVYAAAAKKPQWICYRYEPNILIGILLPDVHVTRAVYSDFAIRANERISRNDIAGAFDDALTILRIGRHITNNSRTFVETFVGIVADKMGIDVIQSILTYGKPSAEQIHQFIKELDNLPKTDQSLDKIIRLQKMFELELLFKLRDELVGNKDNLYDNDDVPPNPQIRLLRWLSILPIDYNVASKRIHVYYAILEEMSKETDVKKRRQIGLRYDPEVMKLGDTIKKTQDTLLRLLPIRYRSELVADHINCFMLPAVGSFANAEAKTETLKDQLRVSFALELYQRENGQYPDNLEALVPKYISVIPDDIFASQKLTYKKNDNGYILYSLGLNEIDDNGDAQQFKDLVVERKIDVNK
ncbi:MAG: hypothetical protein LBQ66_14020 [Planctomycetaceae bacterium]|jgi:hypothetical protein|nr:hypothetical protein [Planctomycetaceae bacterium]